MSHSNMWLVCLNVIDMTVHPVTFQVLPSIQKIFLWALSQMDIRDKSKGFSKCSIWCSRWLVYYPVIHLQPITEAPNQFHFYGCRKAQKEDLKPALISKHSLQRARFSTATFTRHTRMFSLCGCSLKRDKLIWWDVSKLTDLLWLLKLINFLE